MAHLHSIGKPEKIRKLVLEMLGVISLMPSFDDGCNIEGRARDIGITTGKCDHRPSKITIDGVGHQNEMRH